MLYTGFLFLSLQLLFSSFCSKTPTLIIFVMCSSALLLKNLSFRDFFQGADLILSDCKFNPIQPVHIIVIPTGTQWPIPYQSNPNSCLISQDYTICISIITSKLCSICFLSVFYSYFVNTVYRMCYLTRS